MFRFIMIWIVLSTMTPIAYAGAFEDGMTAFEARDYQKAMTLWLSLAEQGDIPSQLNIGEMYAKGLGVTQDIPKAITWFNKAAAQDSNKAAFNLGELYGYGHGIPLDHEQSVKWYQKAAERGHAASQYKLGVKYFKGEGVQTDYLMAYAWMDAASKQELKAADNYRDLIASVLSPDKLEEARALAAQLLDQLNGS